MQPRDKLLVITLLVLTATLSLAGWIASLGRSEAVLQGPLTTYSSEPHGAQALAEALDELGIGVRHFRRRATLLPSYIDSTRPTILVSLNPTPYSPSEKSTLFKLSTQIPLLLAERTEKSTELTPCFGYTAVGIQGSTALKDLLFPDTLSAVITQGDFRGGQIKVTSRLERTATRVWFDSTRLDDAESFRCEVPWFSRHDTLLALPTGEPVVVRLYRAGGGPPVTLVGDPAIFRNDHSRRQPGGAFALSLMSDYSEVIFDEYHHGFDQEGSLRAILLDWSRSSPWGWAIWQVVVVAVMLLLVRAIRFGPTRPGLERQRRSSLEHVNALAAALSAAHGSDEAIRATLRGLRRRLSPDTGDHGDLKQWLSELGERVTDEQQRTLVRKLQTLMEPGQTPSAVRQAANTVEELWQAMRP